jgi:hypothetical protein
MKKNYSWAENIHSCKTVENRTHVYMTLLGISSRTNSKNTDINKFRKHFVYKRNAENSEEQRKAK